MKKIGFVIRIALSSSFIIMNNGCNTTHYEPLYIQKYDGDEILGKPFQMTDETFEIKINKHSEGIWFGSYHPWMDDTYRHISIVDKNGNVLLFQNKEAFKLEILKYGYEIERSDSLFGYYTLRKMNTRSFPRQAH